jgi:hypothetical protein
MGAVNLVPGDTNDTFDIFLFDRQTRTTERVSITTLKTAAPTPRFRRMAVM